MSTVPYLSQIVLFAIGFVPRGWAACNGQLLPINQNQALFSLLGTTYGGDGKVTFALPDLRGRVPLEFGQGPGLSNYALGQSGGTESVTLNVTEMPAHAHTVDASGLTATAKCSSGVANQRSPVGTVPAVEAAGATATYSNAASDANMSSSAIAMGGGIAAAVVGSSQPHANAQPFLTLMYCIALQGSFPSQN